MNKGKSVAFYENKSWYYRTKTLLEDGSIKYSKKGGFSSKLEAEKSYNENIRSFKEAYRKYCIESEVDTSITFKNYLIYWFEELFCARIENTTQMLGRYTLYHLIIPSLENDIKIKYVNTEYLDALFQKISIISKSAGNKSRELISIAMKDAMIDGYINSNPILGTRPYPREKPQVRILDKSQLQAFLKVAKMDSWYLEILLGLLCGLRKGEILGLKFEDIDEKEGTIFIQRQLSSNPISKKNSSKLAESYQCIEKQPKTKNSIRRIKVPPLVLNELENRRLQVNLDKLRLGDIYEDNGYISCQKNGRPHSMSAMNIALTKLCKRNGIPVISVHSLRHMYATILIEKSVPLSQISALLGHSSISTTFEYYCGIINDDENIIAFMNNKFIPV